MIQALQPWALRMRTSEKSTLVLRIALPSGTSAWQTRMAPGMLLYSVAYNCPLASFV